MLFKRHEAIKAEGEKERMRANLLRAVSHDLRTPLTTIYASSLTLLENRSNLTEEQKIKILQGIQEDADWLMRMVENLLSVTRIDSGRIKIVKTPTVLDELIDSVILKFRKCYPNQDVMLDIPDDIVVIPMYASHRPDLVILDLGLADMDGMQFLNFVRKDALTPIIVLSARSDERDKVLALDQGANDYVTKLFGSSELLARIRTTLRNYRHSADVGKLPGGRFVMQDLVIEYDARQVFAGEKEIKLTQTEYNIIAFLSEHCGKMMTYSVIIKGVWGYSDEGSVKKLQVNMANIRKKFGVKPREAKYITNELGVGYRMNGEKDG